MANAGRNKKVSQEDLRRLMAQHKGKAPAAKIDNPLAKFNDAGQLTCALCKSVVRSEAAWPVHVNSRQHKDNIAEAKRLKELTNNFTSVAKAPKRPATPPPISTPSKKIKSILKNSGVNSVHKNLPDDFFQKPKPPNVAPSPSIVMSHDEEIKRAPLKSFPPKTKEAKQEPETSTRGEEHKTGIVPQPADQPLPEGFFDDPILDAKARNMEYKDPVEEEWEKFQKAMREETSASAELIAGEQEEATAERQIDEIDEQIRNWSRVLDLELKKEETSKLKQEHTETAMDKEENTSGSDSDVDEFLDWRAKKSYR